MTKKPGRNVPKKIKIIKIRIEICRVTVIDSIENLLYFLSCLVLLCCLESSDLEATLRGQEKRA